MDNKHPRYSRETTTPGSKAYLWQSTSSIPLLCSEFFATVGPTLRCLDLAMPTSKFANIYAMLNISDGNSPLKLQREASHKF